MAQTQAQITYVLDDKVSAAIQAMNGSMAAYANTIAQVDARLAQMQTAQQTIKFAALSDSFRNLNQSVQQFIQPGAAFQQQLHDLEAITGITGTQLEQLGAHARKVGVESGLGAAQATEAFKILASNIDVASLGNPEQQTAGLKSMQSAVIQLAQAGEVQMPAAAEAMAGALNQFGLAASQSGKVVDILAAGAKAGAAEIPDLAQSIKTTGATAAAAGLSIQDTVGALEVLSQKSIKGEQAGTALRNILLKLQTEGIKGVDVKTQGLVGALEHLKGRLNDTTFLAKTFGAENINAAQILIQNTDAVTKMTAKVDENGIAAQMAATRMDTYNGKMAQIKAQFDDFAITVFNGTNAWLPYMNIAGGALQTLADFAPALELLKGGYAAVATRLTIATTATAAHWATTSGLSLSTRLMTAAQWGLNVALTANPIGLAAGAAIALGAAIYYTYQKSVTFRETVAALGNTFKSMWQSISPIFPYIKDAFSATGSVISTVFTSVMEYTLTPFMRRLQGIADFIRGISEAFKGNWSQAGDAFIDGAWHTLGYETNNDKDAKRLYDYNNGVKPMAEHIGDMGKNIQDAFKSQFNPAKPAVKPKTPTGVVTDTGKKAHGGDSGAGGGGGKIINVRIGQVIGIQHLQTTSVHGAMPEMSSMLKKEMITAIRDAEAIE